MKFRNFDIIFSRDLQSYSTLSSIIYIERLTSEEPIELTLEMVAKLFQKFFKLSDVSYKMDQLEIPVELSNLIENFKALTEITNKSVEDLTCTLQYFGYNLMIIGRIDIDEVQPDLVNDYYYRSYMINNFADNVSGLSCVYSGYSLIYEENGVPTAFDYIKNFGLTGSQMELFELNVASDSYSYLSSTNNLRQFDDTKSLEFIISRGYKYMVLINPV